MARRIATESQCAALEQRILRDHFYRLLPVVYLADKRNLSLSRYGGDIIKAARGLRDSEQPRVMRQNVTLVGGTWKGHIRIA